MSGIVAIINLDGAPLENHLLAELTQFLGYRGPDALQTWNAGPAGLGHAMLRTTEEAESESQPFSLDEIVWIVADARIDAQTELIAKLKDAGEAINKGLTDAELILRAYRVWGEQCVEHLVGDFVFFIWDSLRQSVFCARDQMGVKPFYYARAGDTLILSNTLDCIRQHPAVSSSLNDLAIADFLLFNINQEPGTTCFADIQRLPPAHCVTWTREASRLRKYWTLPIDEPVYLKNVNDYSEQFLDLLRQAISDRLRTSQLGVFMSGGLDSPALVAVALEILRARSQSFSLHAFTSVYDYLIPDFERHFAGLVAEHLDIPIHYDVRDDEVSIVNWNEYSIHTPEPVSNPMAFAASVNFSKKIGEYARVFFYGEGPDDSLIYEWRSYVAYLITKRQWSRLGFDLLNSALLHRRLPIVTTIPAMFRDRQNRHKWDPVFPAWLDGDFVSRLQLKERWNEHHRTTEAVPHSIRPRSYRSMNSPQWQGLFENCDITAGWGNNELRHPFVDIRLLRYVLSVPAIPWCRKKYLIRRSMRHKLPQAVFRRKKTAVPDPNFRRAKASGFPSMLPVERFLAYVNPTKVPSEPENLLEFRSSLRAVGLDYWLRNLEGPRNNKRRPINEHATPAYG